jgi:hypothetical protein
LNDVPGQALIKSFSDNILGSFNNLGQLILDRMCMIAYDLILIKPEEEKKEDEKDQKKKALKAR